jgi:hypothetical protein
MGANIVLLVEEFHLDVVSLSGVTTTVADPAVLWGLSCLGRDGDRPN